MSESLKGSTIKAQLQWASELLYQVSCSSRLDAEVLLAHCLERDRSYLMTWPERELDESELACYRELVRRRLRPEPVAYLIGSREFYSLQLDTTPATLVPRPETEMLVEAVLDAAAGQRAPKILELGTGTGAIALAIKKHCPNCRVTATDFAADALLVAQGNARKLGIEVEFLHSDWFRSIGAGDRFDVIVSNPPYIAEHDPYLGQGDLPAEPRHALCSGETGLEALEVIASAAPGFLEPGGLLVLEHGWDQGAEVSDLLRKSGFEGVETRKDFNDLQRMTLGRLPA